MTTVHIDHCKEFARSQANAPSWISMFPSMRTESFVKRWTGSFPPSWEQNPDYKVAICDNIPWYMPLFWKTSHYTFDTWFDSIRFETKPIVKRDNLTTLPSKKEGRYSPQQSPLFWITVLILPRSTPHHGLASYLMWEQNSTPKYDLRGAN